MTATPAPDAPTLTPARKRLIRQAIRTRKGAVRMEWLCSLPSFAGISHYQLRDWLNTLDRVARQYKPKPAPPAVTQATPAPAAPDPGTTGEWYSAAAIAGGLNIGVERVYGWKQFGWLSGGPLYTAADIRAFVRAHPLEIRHRDLSETSWLWLVSVLAGSREGAA